MMFSPVFCRKFCRLHSLLIRDPGNPSMFHVKHRHIRGRTQPAAGHGLGTNAGNQRLCAHVSKGATNSLAAFFIQLRGQVIYEIQDLALLLRQYAPLRQL
jgi:hypothetical protein